MTIMLKKNNKTSTYCAASSLARIVTAAVTVVAIATISGSTNVVYAGLVKEGGAPDYGVDISFPIHHASVSNNFPWLQNRYNSTQPLQVLGDRQSFYDDFLRGCRQKDGRSCDEAESFRIETNLKQPSSMVVRTLFLFS
jgi:prolyl 4-hydroxylase